eukprot:COSAG01_NODE_1399_length_10465_cov_3.558267_3_plen_310_part_00
MASQAPLDVEALLDDVFGAQGGHRPLMIRALKRLRKHGGLLIGALTNNWVAEPEVDEVAEAARQAESAAFRALFDVFVESSVTGMQKPDPRIYQLALSQLGQLPAETVVFLDDLGTGVVVPCHPGNARPAGISSRSLFWGGRCAWPAIVHSLVRAGVNLKAARALGIRTIKVCAHAAMHAWHARSYAPNILCGYQCRLIEPAMNTCSGSGSCPPPPVDPHSVLCMACMHASGEQRDRVAVARGTPLYGDCFATLSMAAAAAAAAAVRLLPDVTACNAGGQALAELETWTGVELLGAEEQALILRRRSKL